MMDAHSYKELDESEASRWLARIVRDETDIIERRNRVLKVGSDLDEERRLDEAASAAWAYLDDHGHRAKVPPDSSSRSYFIDLFQRDMQSDARGLRLQRAFKEMTGRESVSAREMVEVLDLYVQGKRQAWEGAIASYPPKPEEPVALPPPAPPAPAAAVPSVDPDLMAVARRLNAFKREDGIEPETLKHLESTVGLFTTLTGVSDVRDIHQTTMTTFRSDLAQVPKSWGKSPKDRGASKEVLLARAASLGPDKCGLSAGTVNRHLENINQLLTWAGEEGLEVDARVNTARLHKKDTVRGREKRDDFALEDLRALFQGPIWQGSRAPTRLLEPGKKIFKNGVYWSILLLAHTGARRSEICGLKVADVVTVEGLTCLHIQPNELRDLKTLASGRKIPLVEHLLELGFLDYVQATKKSGETYLFPDLIRGDEGTRGRAAPKDRDQEGEDDEGNCGAYLTQRARTVIDKILGKEIGSQYSLHNLRHFVINALHAQTKDGMLIRDIVGHESKDVHDKVYRKAATPAAMKVVMDRMPRLL